MKNVSVDVQQDHIEKLASRAPVTAICELIWNALDADAHRVDVRVTRSLLGGMTSISVVDDGSGMTALEAEASFGSLGGSWKRTATQTRKGRALHGKSGQGRFMAFALGDVVTWKTAAFDPTAKSNLTFEIVGQRLNMKRFQIGDASAASTPSGTTVVIDNLRNDLTEVPLRAEKSRQEYARTFAMYLRKYPDVIIEVDGHRVDPKSITAKTTSLELDPIETPEGLIAAQVTVIEWSTAMPRSIVYCSNEGMALHEEPPSIHAPGFQFTAYVSSPLCETLSKKGVLGAIESLSPLYSKLQEASKLRLRGYFRGRRAELAAERVAKWKQEHVYPYEGEAANDLESAERQVFDVVASEISAIAPEIEKIDQKVRKLQFRLLRQALESGPSALQKILKEVLDLSEEKQREFADLIDKTSLGSVISSAQMVSRRLEFLSALKHLVFDPEIRGLVNERDHLHKILDDHTWLFGEEYSLTMSERGLREVLNHHRREVGLDEIDVPVTLADGKSARVDLLLAKRIPGARDSQRVFLVVELKRSTVKIGMEQYMQVQKYAARVAADPGFNTGNTRWIFYAISNDVSDDILPMLKQKDRQPGLISTSDSIDVWVKTWGQLIAEAEDRMRLLKESLDYSPTLEQAKEYLKKNYGSIIPAAVTAPAGQTASPSTAPAPVPATQAASPSTAPAPATQASAPAASAPLSAAPATTTPPVAATPVLEPPAPPAPAEASETA